MRSELARSTIIILFFSCLINDNRFVSLLVIVDGESKEGGLT